MVARSAAAASASDILGTDSRSETDFVHHIEEGLPAAALDRLMAYGDFSEAEMDTIIPRRTRRHQRRRGRLSPEQSDRVARAARVLALARETFGNAATANGWMRDPNRALGGDTPLSLLRTGSGARLVETVLTRIGYGVYS